MRNEALESIAAHLGLRFDEIEVLGEPSIGHGLAIQGFLGEKSRLFYSALDRSEVIAIARSLTSCEIPVDKTGAISIEKLRANSPSKNDVFALQLANLETGVLQNTEEILKACSGAMIACDATALGAHARLPSRWDSALFDSQSWQGPAGLGILAIRSAVNWRNPLPHIGALRTPNSYSLPLLLASALALDAWIDDARTSLVNVRALNKHLRDEIARRIPNCDIAGELDSSLPHITSVSFLYCEGEELLHALEKLAITVDSGSACTAEDLQPSHVLAAMGVLTHGNIRITLPLDVCLQEVDLLIESLTRIVAEARSK